MSSECNKRRLMTDEEVSQHYGFSKYAINQARRMGTMPGVVSIPGIRKFYYDASIIDKWLDNGTVEQGLRLAK